ncbi:hypothetical protein [Microbacterium xylanilyticum]
MADKINESIVWGGSQPHQRTGDGQDEVQLIDLPHVLLNRAPSRARVEPSPPARWSGFRPASIDDVIAHLDAA